MGPTPQARQRRPIKDAAGTQSLPQKVGETGKRIEDKARKERDEMNV